MYLVRSNTFKINTDKKDHEDLRNTVDIYRRYVRDLMILVNAQWRVLSVYKGNEVIKAVESIIHPTQKRPNIKYSYFSRRYYKFPSYLRRVAIMDAVGQVRSFNTRYDQWLDGDRKSRPPKLTCATSTFPSLYKGQCIRFGTKNLVEIKVYRDQDWIWITLPMRGSKRFIDNGKDMSPLLVYKNRRWKLSIPTRINADLKNRTDFTGLVLAVDVGINTTATCSIVDKYGTVHDRLFIRRSDKDRETKLMQRVSSTAKTATRHGNKLCAGFCTQDYRRLKQLADNEAHQISRKIVNHARTHGCDGIAVEDLKRWRPAAGRKRSSMKARFHRWYHRMLVTRIESKALESGIRCIHVYARGTSSQAYDGSGTVKRSKTNYSLCTFTSGKTYNADLNASLNIAARAVLKLYYPELCKLLRSQGKPNACPTTGNPLTLSSLWILPQAMV